MVALFAEVFQTQSDYIPVYYDVPDQAALARSIGEETLRIIAHLAPHMRVYAWDYRGLYNSERPEDAGSFEYTVDEVIELQRVKRTNSENRSFALE